MKMQIERAVTQALPQLVPAAQSVLQRKCDCGNHTAGGGGCDERQMQHSGSQRHARGVNGPAVAPPVVNEVLQSPGQPLDQKTRAFFEPRFGRDFSNVRIHTDAKAAESSRSVGALAYTVGRDVVFGAGQYFQGTSTTTRLLAHELTHVAQQAHSSPVSMQTKLSIAGPADAGEREADMIAERVLENDDAIRPERKIDVTQVSPRLVQTKADNCSSSGTSCAIGDACAAPDSGGTTRDESTSWALLVKIDVERGSFEDALRSQELGHTNVLFTESNGRRYSYGFYPAGELPNENRRSVPGCARHPDTTHDTCIDDTVAYSLTRAQYDAALALAQRVCRDRRAYGVSYTCTTFAEEVVRAAGQTIPSSRSAPMTIYYQNVPPIDNPNTLLENVQTERRRDPYRHFPVWNDPCINRCEFDFNNCLQERSGGLDSLRPLRCISQRDACFRRCAAQRSESK